MTNIKLTKLHQSDKDKEGKPLVGKNGKSYTRLGVKCEEYGDKWLSGFAGKMTENWKEGDVVTIELTKKGDYLNFRPIGKLEQLEIRVAKLEEFILSENAKLVVLPTADLKEVDLPVEEDLPF